MICRRPENLELLLPQLGLNDEGLDEFPPELHPFCGQGLRVWQYPSQFAGYLAQIVSLGVRSYVELGIRHGGSFVTTVEVLERFRRLDYAVAVDVIPCPAMAQYAAINPRIEFACMNTQAAGFAALLARLRPIDLIFIDSHHEEDQCRREVAAVRDCAEHARAARHCERRLPGHRQGLAGDQGERRLRLLRIHGSISPGWAPTWASDWR